MLVGRNFGIKIRKIVLSTVIKFLNGFLTDKKDVTVFFLCLFVTVDLLLHFVFLFEFVL